MRKAAFLDRDGVLNRAVVKAGKPFPPATVSELEILPGVEDSLQRLREAGYLTIVVTNQPDVARGTTTRSAVEAINTHLQQALALDAFYVCWHDDSAACGCRKPAPGLILQSASDYNVDRAASFMIGDRWRDIEAGQRAGCRTVWINRHYDERAPVGAEYETDELESAVSWIMKFNGKATNETRS